MKDLIYYIHLYQDAVLWLPVHRKHEDFFLFLRQKWTGFISTTLIEDNICISVSFCIGYSEKGIYRKIFFPCEYSIWMMMSESGSPMQMQRGIIYINADTFDNNKW